MAALQLDVSYLTIICYAVKDYISDIYSNILYYTTLHYTILYIIYVTVDQTVSDPRPAADPRPKRM